MLKHVKEVCSKKSIDAMMTSAQIEYSHSPYYVFRPILRQLLNLDSSYFQSLDSSERLNYLTYQICQLELTSNLV